MNNSSSNPEWHQISLFDVKIDVLSLNQLLAAIQNCIRDKKKTIISNTNLYALNIAYSTPWFRNFLNQSYVTFCDGIGIKLAAWLTRKNIPYRYTPPDFVENIAELALKSGWKIFFLGANPGVAQRAAEKLLKKYSGLQVETHHGYFNKNIDSPENKKVVLQINQFQPQFLILGFGMPMQEKWILENIANLHINIAFPAGALFDYLSGEIKRAPRWMTDHGLEWLGRFLVEPRRLWKRYIIGNPLFFWRLFIHHVLGISLPR